MGTKLYSAFAAASLPAPTLRLQAIAGGGVGGGAQGRDWLQMIAEIVQLGLSLDVDYALTLSCYDPTSDGLACGHCDSCRLRRKGFAESGVPDPTRYAAPVA